MNEILDALKTAMQTAFTTRFTTYFIGKVVLVAQDNLPILMVYPISTKQSHSGTLRDAAEYRLAVEIRVSLKQYLDNTNGNTDKLDTLEALIDLIEDRDSQGAAESDTVIGILNANLTAGNRVLYTDDMEVQYEQYLEANKFPIAKATVTFTAHDRPNRTA